MWGVQKPRNYKSDFYRTNLQTRTSLGPIGELRPSSMLVDIFSPLIGLGIPNAKKQCKTRVENLPVESWKSYFEGQADWLFELVEKCPSEFKLTINSMAVTAAVALIDERAAAFNPSERARFRRLMPWLNAHAVRKIVEAVFCRSSTQAPDCAAIAPLCSGQKALSYSPLGAYLMRLSKKVDPESSPG